MTGLSTLPTLLPLISPELVLQRRLQIGRSPDAVEDRDQSAAVVHAAVGRRSIGCAGDLPRDEHIDVGIIEAAIRMSQLLVAEVGERLLHEGLSIVVAI